MKFKRYKNFEICVIIVTRNGKIVWKHGPNGLLYALMLKTMLY